MTIVMEFGYVLAFPLSVLIPDHVLGIELLGESCLDCKKRSLTL